MSKAPNFFIVGAPKCGTTALSEYLRTHPNVFMSTPKEPHYFADDLADYRHVTDMAAYEALFANVESRHLAIGEASVFYLYSAEAIENIHRFRPDAKLIVMLRNPVDMLHALHGQLLYTQDENEANFETAWRLQALRKQGDLIPRHCRSSKILQYRALGLLGSQVSNVLKWFPTSQVKIILFEDFSAKTAEIYADVLEFLELPMDQRDSFEKINASHSHKSSLLGRFLWRPPHLLQEAWIKFKAMTGIRFAPGDILRAYNTQEQKRAPISKTFKTELLENFAEDIILLESLLHSPLSSWRQP
jgi:hypothetical protein